MDLLVSYGVSSFLFRVFIGVLVITGRGGSSLDLLCVRLGLGNRVVIVIVVRFLLGWGLRFSDIGVVLLLGRLLLVVLAGWLLVVVSWCLLVNSWGLDNFLRLVIAFIRLIIKECFRHV